MSTLRNWIKGAERNGWRVDGAAGLEMRLRCSCIGCDGAKLLPLDNLGPIPEPCALPHDGMHARKVFDEYRALVEHLRRRRRSLGLDQQDLNDAMGLADGHLNKLESFARVAAPPTLLLWCQSLGLQLTVTPAPLPAATARAIEARQSRPYQEQQARWKHAAQPSLIPDDRQPR
ncbi:MAG: hypothetical protein EP341_11445 [Sphingomonadales bacterium]|nr:MAG: hypothetical protein EP341_11445 [Sphingomonadales bacterium]